MHSYSFGMKALRSTNTWLSNAIHPFAARRSCPALSVSRCKHSTSWPYDAGHPNMLKVHDTTHHSITTDGYQSKHSFSTSGSPSTVVTEQSARLASEEPAARQTGYAQKPLSKAVSDPPVGRERPGSAGMWDWKHQEEQLLPCNPCDPDVPYNGGASLWGDKEDGPAPFRLTTTFVDKYKTVQPPFGFNGLGEFVYQTRYSRVLPDGSKEQWWQTVERVVNGTYNMQKRWIQSHQLGWDGRQAQASARKMYDKIFHMKFLPPGRGLWAMGSPMTEERHMFAALNNCAFVSTYELGKDPSKPFTFLMDASMLGVGVGFDTDGAGTVTVKGVAADKPVCAYQVPDSREGWVESVRRLLDAHFHGKPRPMFDYSSIRPRGSPIKGFGGTASGPEVLRRLHEDIEGTMSPLAGKAMTVTAIVDVMNQIGRCVVSGDVRQTAEIAFGRPDLPEYIDLKDYARNPARAAWGWTSNNSVYAPLGMRYDEVAQRVQNNGEPGFAWLHNMQRYGRMGDAPNDKDRRAKGGNPCLEQTLESYELCCLVETFPANHDSYEEFEDTLKYAYLYAKTVTLGRTHWPQTNRVLLRNRRIGCSISGVAQFIASKGLGTLQDWLNKGYERIQQFDESFSGWLTIPRSIKTTCVKPSGTVSLLAGATPGMHFPESRFYLRRVRVVRDHEVVAPLQAAGYHVEPAVEDPGRKVVVTFPVDAAAHGHALQPVGSDTSAGASGGRASSSTSSSGSLGELEPLPASIAHRPSALRTLDEVSMWEQFALAAFLQRYWADNQVSCTITFDPTSEGPQIARALDMYQYQLKGVSLLPRAPKAQYAQLPYEAITEEEYKAAMGRLQAVDFSRLGGGKGSSVPDKFCDTSRCDLEAASGGIMGMQASGSAAPQQAGAEAAGTAGSR